MKLCVSLITLVAPEQSVLRMSLLLMVKIFRLVKCFMLHAEVALHFPMVNPPVPIKLGHVLKGLIADVAAERPVARVHQVMPMKVGDPGESPGAKAAL